MSKSGLKISDVNEIEKIFAKRTPKIMGNFVDFAVLVPLVKKDGELNLLFEVRSANLKTQPSEVCFPGGKIEEGESAENCAIRETAEELGIDYDDIRIITELDTLHNYTNLTLYSFLGEIEYDKLVNAKINHKEVESVFYVPLAEFVLNEPYIYKMKVIPDIGDDFPYDMINTDSYNWRKGDSEVPIYQVHEEKIWGLTARICHNLAKILKEELKL